MDRVGRNVNARYAQMRALKKSAVEKWKEAGLLRNVGGTAD